MTRFREWLLVGIAGAAVAAALGYRLLQVLPSVAEQMTLGLK